MLTRRVIPVVLMRGGVAVQSRGFRRYQPLGNPVTIVERLSDWASDELIYLDITRDGRYDLGRDDLGAANRDGVLAILDDIASRCFMPLTFGGGIRSVADAAVRIERGADKVSVRGGALEDGGLVDAIEVRAPDTDLVVISMRPKSHLELHEDDVGRADYIIYTAPAGD